MNYERIAARFQQRLAESVSRYEGDIVLLQDQYEDRIEELNAEIERLQNRVNNLEAGKDVSEESTEVPATNK